VDKTAEIQSTMAALDIDQAVVPWIGADECPDEAAWIARAEAMANAGEQLRAAGLTLSYHNHDHEFQQIGGRYIFDIMLESVNPEHLYAEIDTYWVKFAGADPVEVLKRYTGRLPLVHIKDMAPDPPHGFAEVGRGIMDWSTIMPAARDAGAQWFIVEQDECEGDSLEAVAVSAAFMAKMTI
jgi:sugar phosphate isomerase/epimerase